MSKRKSNKKVKQMIKDVCSAIYLDDEECFVPIVWSKTMVPAVEDIRACNVTLDQYFVLDVVDLGVISLTANQLKGIE